MVVITTEGRGEDFGEFVNKLLIIHSTYLTKECEVQAETICQPELTCVQSLKVSLVLIQGNYL
jgi:hypothetical protein